MPLTLKHLNQAPLAEALRLLDGVYEHSPWIVEQALAQRPFASLPALHQACVRAVERASGAAQQQLIGAHPELAGKAMVEQALTHESTGEQRSAGLAHCSPAEFARLQQLNTQYNARFGWPFILAVRGPRGTGLTRQQILATFERRLQHTPAQERAECLRQIHRIAELRLNDKFGHTPLLGQQVWDWQEQLATFSEPGFAEQGQLTVTYLSAAHRACARQIATWMHGCGFDEVTHDAVGNVVGRYHAADPNARYLLTGSHYDTVRNAGKYDGRLGIFVPMAVVRELHRSAQRLPVGLEVVAFAEEEGQRFSAAFLGSSALAGSFQTDWLELQDEHGTTMRQAMQQAGLDPAHIPALARAPKHYLGFVEVHIEQGPLLLEQQLPLGVVSAINGSARFNGQVLGTASHAGTTPMGQRHDAACAVAELLLFLERRAAQDGDAVGTVGQLHVPEGSVNVVPGRCAFSLDLRAPSNTQRDALIHDVTAELAAICQRRGVQHQLQETLRASAAPCNPAWQTRWANAVATLGLPVFHLPSGAGHDAMKLHERLPQAMLFVRGENGGISHNPLESTTCEDMDLAVRAFQQLVQQLAHDT